VNSRNSHITKSDFSPAKQYLPKFNCVGCAIVPYCIGVAWHLWLNHTAK
jgi:hypothetical protein